MILRTGTRAGRKGFTFIEVMVTLTVLSLGFVMIFKAYVVAMDQMTYLTNRLYAATFLDNHIVRMERALRAYNTISYDAGEPKKVKVGSKNIYLKPSISVAALKNLDNLFYIDLTMRWTEGKYDRKIAQSAYISNFRILDE